MVLPTFSIASRTMAVHFTPILGLAPYPARFLRSARQSVHSVILAISTRHAPHAYKIQAVVGAMRDLTA